MTPKQRIGVREFVIQARGELIVVTVAAARGHHVPARNVKSWNGLRNIRKEVSSHSRNPVCRNAVPGKRLACERIENYRDSLCLPPGCRRSCQVALQLISRRHKGGERAAATVSESFIVAEHKQSILQNRGGDGGPILVVAQGRLRALVVVVEEVGGI